MDSGGEGAGACPADRLVRLLSGQWTPHIVHALGEGGPTRFSALQRALGSVTAKVLSQRLKALEADGLLWRHEEPTIPPRTTYGLTALGEEVHTHLKALDAPAGAADKSSGER